MKNVIISRNGPNSLHEKWLANWIQKLGFDFAFYDEDSFRKIRARKANHFITWR